MLVMNLVVYVYDEFQVLNVFFFCCSLYSQQLQHQAAIFDSIRNQATGGGSYGGAPYGGSGGFAGGSTGSYGGVGSGGTYG